MSFVHVLRKTQRVYFMGTINFYWRGFLSGEYVETKTN
jgi:hypothetical protein